MRAADLSSSVSAMSPVSASSPPAPASWWPSLASSPSTCCRHANTALYEHRSCHNHAVIELRISFQKWHIYNMGWQLDKIDISSFVGILLISSHFMLQDLHYSLFRPRSEFSWQRVSLGSPELCSLCTDLSFGQISWFLTRPPRTGNKIELEVLLSFVHYSQPTTTRAPNDGPHEGSREGLTTIFTFKTLLRHFAK